MDSSSKNNSFKRQTKEATYKAQVIQPLGDHPGKLLLFEVMLQQQPVSIKLKFHGNGNKSLTVFKAGKTGKIERRFWISLVS